jgi:hypothetical protein
MLDVGVELGSGQVTAVESLGANGDGVDDVLVTGNGLLDGGPVLGEGRLREQVIGIGGLADPVEKEKCVRAVSMWWDKPPDLPHAQNNLEALVLRGRQDILGSVTLRTGVGTDEGGQVLQSIEVGFIVAGGLASAIGVLVTERETQSALGGNEGRGSSQEREDTSTHDER